MLDVMHTMWPDETRADVEAMWLGDLEADEPPPAETKPEERTS
jgi:hypothetical protein